MLKTGREKLAAVLLGALSVAALAGWLGPALALVAGVGLALLLGNPLRPWGAQATGPLLQAAVVGLGFGLPLDVVLRTAREGLVPTLLSLGLALGAGALLARWLAVEERLGVLLSVGTAICGGSAIAAVAPVLKASHEEMAVAMGGEAAAGGPLRALPPHGAAEQGALWQGAHHHAEHRRGPWLHQAARAPVEPPARAQRAYTLLCSFTPR